MTTLDGREVRGHHPQRVNCGLLVSWSPVTPKGGVAERARSSRNRITRRGWFAVTCRSDTLDSSGRQLMAPETGRAAAGRSTVATQAMMFGASAWFPRWGQRVHRRLRRLGSSSPPSPARHRSS